MTTKGRFASLFDIGKRLPTARINNFILVATVAILLPLIVLNSVLLSRLETARQESNLARATTDATFIARNISHRLDDMQTHLRLLTDMPELKRRDFDRFQTLVESSLSIADYRSVILPVNDAPLVNPNLEPDLLPFLETVSREIKRQWDRGEREFCGFTFDTITQSWTYYVAVILPSHPAQVPNALVLIKTSENLEKALAPEILNKNWSVALLDADSNIVISSANASQDTADTTTPNKDILDALKGAGGTMTQDGIIYISEPVPGRAWNVLVWSPTHSDSNVVAEAFTYLAVGSSAIFILALLLAYLVGKHLRGAIHSLSKMAMDVGEGKLVPPVETRIAELDSVARALTTASYDRHLAQEHSDIVLQELVHRSKNTIALLQAIMRQLTKETTTVEAYHKAVDQRMRGFAKSMSELATVQWSGVDLETFVASHLEVFGNFAQRIDVGGPSMVISPTAAQNLGLVIHELVTNSIKHGALSQDIGRSSIKWQLTPASQEGAEERFHICWLDKANGITESKNVTGFGSTIIERHAEYAFSGNVKINYTDGKFHWHLSCASKNMLDIRPSKAH